MPEIRWMVRSSVLLLSTCLAGLCSDADAPPREMIFADDFSATAPGESPLGWSAFSGHWFVTNGVVRQDAGGFDHGMVVGDLYLRCDYRIETKVRLVNGGGGAGLYWNVAEAITGENGNMLRYDGNYPIMFGWMRGRGFLGTGGATGNLKADGSWHTLRMDVYNEEGTFDLFWDGEQIVDNAAMLHRHGHVGLECSLGVCEFDDVRVSVAQGTEWRATPQGEIRPEWVQSLALLGEETVYPVPGMHRIQAVSDDGRLLWEFGRKGSAPGELDSPAAVAVDAENRVYVTDTGNRRVQVFSRKGEVLRVIRPEGEDALERPFGIAVDAEGRIWVGDRAKHRITAFAADGTIDRILGKEGAAPGEFRDPAHLKIVDDLLYVADRGNRRIQVFRLDDPDAEPRVIPVNRHDGPWSVDVDGNGRFVVATGRGLSLYDADWNHLKEHTADALGEIWTKAAIFYPPDSIVIADYWRHQLVILPDDLPSLEPAATVVTPTSARIMRECWVPVSDRTWFTSAAVGADMLAPPDYGAWDVLGDPDRSSLIPVELTGLTPSTRYAYAVALPHRVIPSPDLGVSVPYRFVTQDEPGTVSYAEVPLAILCYSHVTHEAGAPEGQPVPEPTVRDEAWFNRVIDAHEAMRYFYWTNSRFALDPRCFYLNVERPVDFSFLGSSSGEVHRDLEVLAEKEGLEPTDFGAVIVIGGNCCYAYPYPTPWWGGKLTHTTGCCFAGGGDVWLSTHEFHHLTEGWMHMIRYPVGEVGYGHADMPWRHDGAFGENFDFLAHTLRAVPRDTYRNLAVGRLVVTADADNDRVPDDEARCIFDEKRAGTSPETTDSYGNGLTDLQNLTAEVFRPALLGHDHALLGREIDLKHPFAVFDYEYDRSRATPVIDGSIGDGEWDVFVETPNAATTPDAASPIGRAWPSPPGADYRFRSYVNWDDDNLYIAMTAPYPFLVDVQLDCDADGYFHGKDNPRFTVQIARDAEPPTADTALPAPNVMVWNNVEPVEERGVPDWRNDLFDRKDDLRWRWGRGENGWYVVETSIPKCPNVGLDLETGEEMGMRLWIQGLLPPTEEKPDGRYAFELLDSCEYAHFRLVSRD